MIDHSSVPALDPQRQTTSQLCADRPHPLPQALRDAQAEQRVLDTLLAQAQAQADVTRVIMQQHRAGQELLKFHLSLGLHDIGMIARGERSDAARLQAAERLVTRVGRVIHPRRWPLVRDEAAQQAALHHGGDVSAEVRQRTITALFELLPQHYHGIMSGPYDTAYPQLRRKLQAAVTRDFLGPRWTRRQRSGEILVPPERLPQRALQVQDLPALDDLFHNVAFSPREVEILERLFAKASLDEIAADLGITKATLYVHCHNIRQKVARRR
jgi:hypothetical protein